MKQNERLDVDYLFGDLARDLDNYLANETGEILNIVDFIRHEVDLGIELSRNQLLPLKIAYECPLDDEDLAVLDYWKAAKKTTWSKPRESAPQVLVIEAGRRSGKSTIAALIGAYEFYRMSKLDSPQKHYGVATSTPIGILCLATTAEQAKKNIFRQIIQICRNSEYFRSLERKKELFIGKEEIAYARKGLYIQSGNSKSASQVGSTLKCFILDEASRFQDTDGRSNALDLWSNIGISCAPFGAEARLVAISSGWFEGDAIERLYESTKTDPFAVGFKLVSWDLNTTINKDNPIVAHEYAENPTKAALEYEGIRPAAADAFLNPVHIHNCFKGTSVIEASRYTVLSNDNNLVKLSIQDLEHRPTMDTVLHIDPALKGDTYAMAFGHSEFNDLREQIVVIDGLLAWQPTGEGDEVSITNVGDVIRKINALRPLSLVTADHYNSAETIQRLKEEGIRSNVVYFSNRQQLMMYTRIKTLMAEGKLILPKDSLWTDLLRNELRTVQLLNGVKIDHPADKSKDLADAVAAVAYALSERVLKDDIRGGDLHPQFLQRNIIYAEEESNLQDRSKALNRIKHRRQWAKQELLYSKNPRKPLYDTRFKVYKS